jgi:hypothetical protein
MWRRSMSMPLYPLKTPAERDAYHQAEEAEEKKDSPPPPLTPEQQKHWETFTDD